MRCDEWEIHQPEIEALIEQRMASGAFRNVEDFRKANLCVDGAVITELSSLPLTSVVVASPATLSAGVSADLLVTGSALVPGDTSLVAFGLTVPLASISQDGKTGHATLTIPNDYDAKLAYAAYTESAKTGQQSQPVTIALAPPE